VVVEKTLVGARAVWEPQLIRLIVVTRAVLEDWFKLGGGKLASVGADEKEERW
jgi:hypothetical protein